MDPRIVHEIDTMCRLQHHPNILKIHEVLATKTKIYLIVDFDGIGELFSKLSHCGRLPKSLAHRYFSQLVSSLHFCHHQGYKLGMNAFDIISMSSGLDLRGLFETMSDKGRRWEKRFTSDKSVEAVETKVKEVGLNLGFRVEVGKNGAIGLGWDTVVRFSSYSEILREGFFADFAQVADDESHHFSWCAQRLAKLGFKYGDMPAHNLLWRECEKSLDNVAARLAVIPLVQVPFRKENGQMVTVPLFQSQENIVGKVLPSTIEILENWLCSRSNQK